MAVLGIGGLKLQREVNLTPEGKERREALAREHARLKPLYEDDQRELLVELAGVGLHLQTVWDLVNSRDAYPLAVPILIRHLSVPHMDRIREGIGRALTVKAARDHWDELKALYLREPQDTGAKTGMAVALGGIAGAAQLDDVIGILEDPTQGSTRIFFLQALRRSRSPAAVHAIERFRRFPEFEKEIESWRPRRAR